MVLVRFAHRGADPARRSSARTMARSPFGTTTGRQRRGSLRTMNGKLLVTALLACGLPLAAAGTATAESIVFIKDKNLWVANPDGSSARAITSDGAQSAYWSPSQADDGTIAVAHRQGVE